MYLFVSSAGLFPPLVFSPENLFVIAGGLGGIDGPAEGPVYVPALARAYAVMVANWRGPRLKLVTVGVGVGGEHTCAYAPSPGPRLGGLYKRAAGASHRRPDSRIFGIGLTYDGFRRLISPYTKDVKFDPLNGSAPSLAVFKRFDVHR